MRVRALWALLALGVLGAAPAAAPPATHVQGDRLKGLLLGLAEFGKNPEGGVSRLGFSREDQAAHAWLVERMKEAGLEVWVDAAANVHGRRAGTDAGQSVLLFGSHIDSVPKGGNYDGDVGSMGALEVMLALRDEKAATRHPFEMVVWSNEEGVHFGKGVFGSRMAARGPDAGELDARDEEGVTLADWLRRSGADPSRMAEARLDPRRVASYLELHIEQGGVLDRGNVQIGVVQGIVGRPVHVTLGASPTTRGRRRCRAPRRPRGRLALVLAVREEVMARPGRQVGNVGFVQVQPRAPTSCRLVRMPVELRDLDRKVIDDMARASAPARGDRARTGVAVTMELTPPTARPTDPGLRTSSRRRRGAGY